jgi:hypothetical protein
MKNSNTQRADHLNEFTRNFLNTFSEMDVEKRIRLIQTDKWIGYLSARKIVERIENLIEMERINRMHSLLIMGSTDNGKTSIRKRVESKYRMTTTVNGKIQMPVVSIQMPPAPDARCFYNSILKGMMLPIVFSGKIDYIRDLVIDSLREYNVRCLMIDEVQTIDRIPDKKQRTILDTIKYISNEISLPMVAFGTTEARHVFARDPQLDNRFKKVHLTRWECNDDFQKLLWTYEKLLPLKEPSNLGEPSMAQFIYSLTNGTIGEIVTLIRMAAIEAVRSGIEKITVDNIKAVNFESVAYKSDY